VQAKLGSDRFEVVALSIDRAGAGVVRKFYDEIGIEHLTLYIDPTMKAQRTLRIFGIPATILLGPDGMELGRLGRTRIASGKDMATEPDSGVHETGWLCPLRRYMLVVAGGHLVWEFAHMPLYTLWNTGSPGEIVFGALHCTGGDVLIALSAIMLALFLAGTPRWPAERLVIVVSLTVAIGLGYTIFSEWLNIEVRGAWAYREIMPIVPVIGAGLSPVLQWIVVPLAAFWLVLKPAPTPPREKLG